VRFYKFLQTVISRIIRLVSYRTKHKSTSSSVLFVDWWETVTRHRACYEVGLMVACITQTGCCSLD